MARFLSASWFDEMNTAAGSAKAAPAGSTERLALRHVITGGPDGDVTYLVVIDKGAVSFVPGDDAAAPVTFTQDYDTAVAISKGELTAQAAFMIGRIRAGGEVGLLLTHQGALAGIDDVFEPVRAATSY